MNDHDGNPIEIAAVVVWRAVDTAEAIFEVDNYQNFVQVQSEAAHPAGGEHGHHLPLVRCPAGTVPAGPRADEGAAWRNESLSSCASTRTSWRLSGAGPMMICAA